MRKISFVPGTVKPAIFGSLVMLAEVAITTGTGWDDTSAGKWVSPTIVVVTYGITLYYLTRAKRRWRAQSKTEQS